MILTLKGRRRRVSWKLSSRFAGLGLSLLIVSLILCSCGDKWYIGGFSHGYDEKDKKGNTIPAKPSDYYVVGRYYCVARSNGEFAGTCDVYTHSAKSCQDAMQLQQADVAGRTDVCVQCQPNEKNNAKRFDSTRDVEWIQGGPCEGLQRASTRAPR